MLLVRKSHSSTIQFICRCGRLRDKKREKETDIYNSKDGKDSVLVLLIIFAHCGQPYNNHNLSEKHKILDIDQSHYYSKDFTTQT